MRFHKESVRRDAIPLPQHDEIAAHDLAAGDAVALAATHDKRAWTGKIAQGLENALGACLLHHGDGHR